MVIRPPHDPERIFVIERDGIARIMRIYNDAFDVARVVAGWQELARAGANVAKARQIVVEDIPNALLGFKDAWEDDGVNITTNMVKARTIQREKVLDMVNRHRDKLTEAEIVEALGLNFAALNSDQELFDAWPVFLPWEG